MNTLTQRFGVPATCAAAFHAVLLFCIGKPDPIVTFRPPGEALISCAIPAQILEVFRPEPKASDDEAPVHPLASGPAAPSLPEEFAPTRSAFTIDVPVRAPTEGPKVERLPLNGPGDGNGPGVPWAGPAPTFVASDSLDRTPRALAQPAPIYPTALRQAGVDGEVWVEFNVDTAGRVLSARVLRSADSRLDEVALAAVAKWRFEPGRKEGRVVPFRMAVPMMFRIGDD